VSVNKMVCVKVLMALIIKAGLSGTYNLTSFNSLWIDTMNRCTRPCAHFAP